MVAIALPGIFVMGCLVHVYLMDSYVIRCPEQAEWNIRAEIRCQNEAKYFCLYNDIDYSYQEGCIGPDWDRPGSKRIYSRNFNRAPCNDTRYQPIKFVTNGNSDCIFRKSLCTEEGQTLFEAGTTRTDSTCRCDYKQGYAFVTVPRNKCYCHPSEEDCSCYLKKCQDIGYYLSADYECTKNGTKKTVCSLMSENPSEDPHIDMVPTGTPREYDSYAIKRTDEVAILVSICLVFMIVSSLCAMFIDRHHRYIQQSIKNIITMYIMLQQRLPRSRLSTEQTFTTETERMDKGQSLNTIGQNASNDESGGNRLEETVSGNNKDNQIVLRESDEVQGNSQNGPVKLAVTGKSGIASSDENWISSVDELKNCIEKEGLETALTHFNDDLDKWKNEPVKLAVTGKSGVGKSSFINAIRNLKSGDPGFATSSSSGNTTTIPTIYEYPGNSKITLHDLPGFGTIDLPANEYGNAMELHKYDYILIFVGNIEENDIKIAKKLTEMEKPFCFVRSKIDIDIQNASNDGESKRDALGKIISKSSDNLKHAGFYKVKFFVISNCHRRSYQFHDLVSYIQSNLPGLKYDAVVFSILGELSVDIIDSKYKILKDRLWKLSLASVALSRNYGYSVNIRVVLICKELLLYHKVFGFEQQFIKDILKNDNIRQKLNVRSIIEIQPADEAMQTFVISELEKLKTSAARESRNDLIVPYIDSAMSECPVGGDTVLLLIQVLDGCREDSKLVYSHVMSVDV